MEKQNSKSDQLTITDPQKNGVKKTSDELVGSSPDILLQMAVNKDLDIDKLQKLVEMKERYDEREARKKFFTALAGFQSEMSKVAKEKAVSYGQGKTAYTYATFDAIVEQARPLLFKYDLSYQFKIKDEGEKIIVTCVLTHIDGHSEETTMSGLPDDSGSKNKIQGRASAIAYMSRYTFTGSLGITTGNDTDGKTLNTSENWRDEIKGFKDYDSLAKYGNSHSLKTDPEFRDAMNAQIKLIKEGK